MTIFCFKSSVIQTYFPENSGLNPPFKQISSSSPFNVEILQHCFFFFFFCLKPFSGSYRTGSRIQNPYDGPGFLAGPGSRLPPCPHRTPFSGAPFPVAPPHFNFLRQKTWFFPTSRPLYALCPLYETSLSPVFTGTSPHPVGLRLTVSFFREVSSL